MSLSISDITKRDQIPILLKELGLNGIGAEVGVALGRYSNTVLRYSNLTLMFGIDRWSDHHDVTQYSFVMGQSIKWDGRYVVLRETFSNAVKLFNNEIFDFIYIDGYAHTGQDDGITLVEWWPKLKKGGILGIHDYHEKWPKNIKIIDKWSSEMNLTGHLTDEDRYPSWVIQK